MVDFIKTAKHSRSHILSTAFLIIYSFGLSACALNDDWNYTCLGGPSCSVMGDCDNSTYGQSACTPKCTYWAVGGNGDSDGNLPGAKTTCCGDDSYEYFEYCEFNTLYPPTVDWNPLCVPSKTACCRGSSCVDPFTQKCYLNSWNGDLIVRYYKVAGATNLNDTYAKCGAGGKWLNCDINQTDCAACAMMFGTGLDKYEMQSGTALITHRWVKSGALGVGQYPNTNTLMCCGDDLNEYYQTCNGAPGFDVGSCKTPPMACCPRSSDCVFGGTCVSSGSSADANNDMIQEYCDGGQWCTSISQCGYSTLSLDFGNDSSVEWSRPRSFRGPERIDALDYINFYVRGGCWCNGCVLDQPSGNCTVPIILRSDYPGNFTLNDVSLKFSKATVLAEVGYGMPFRTSEGGCWKIQYPGGFTGNLSVPPEYKGGNCVFADYFYRLGSGPITTEDAVDDAVYRLLNGTLDVAGDGIIDIPYHPENMSFEAEGQIGTQSMWGPVQMRLVVWS